jgi:hypothetical protein
MRGLSGNRAILALGVSLGGLAALAVAATTVASRAADTVQALGPGKTRTFVVSYVWNSFPGSDKDCPEGLNPAPDKEVAISRLPAEQQDAYRKDEAKSMRILSNRGPKGENVCTFPTVLPDPGFKISQSTVQDGFDLEKTLPASQVCKHPQMTNALGQTGVDNQLSRVLGCIQHRRANGFFPKYFVNQMRTGEYTYLVEVTGIDDERNDPSVEVGLYASDDPIVLDSSGRPLSHASLQITREEKYQHHLHGRIVDGVLTTDPKDIVLPYGSVFPPLDLKNAMLRLTLKSDGTAEGALGGYQDWEAFYRANVSAGSIAETSGGPFQCTGFYYALKHAADGLKDPKTGECTAISAAYKIEAIQTYVIHPKRATVASAQAAQSKQ